MQSSGAMVTGLERRSSSRRSVALLGRRSRAARHPVATEGELSLMAPLPGIHHVTAISGDAQRNVDFYAGLLGLRLVKKTVNFDDPGSYHLYYGDELGRPGSVMTFFVWPGAPRGRQGPGQVLVTSFAVPH